MSEPDVEIGQLWRRPTDRLGKRITKVGRRYAHFSDTSPVLSPSRILIERLVETHDLVQLADGTWLEPEQKTL